MSLGRARRFSSWVCTGSIAPGLSSIWLLGPRLRWRATRVGLKLCSDPPPVSLHLGVRYDLLGGVDDLNGPVLFDRDALALCPPGHPNRSRSLSHLALHLDTRYKLRGGAEDLNKAILPDRDALALGTPGHMMTINDLPSLMHGS